MVKYYAVLIGHHPGIYTDWPTAQQQVYGFSGAMYKSFHSQEEAERYMNSGRREIGSSVQAGQQGLVPSVRRHVIYTDGSGNGGFGLVALLADGVEYRAYGRVPFQATNNMAELYAIFVGLSLFPGDALIYTDSNYSIGSLTTTADERTLSGNWNLPNGWLIKATAELKTGRQIEFAHVSAHVGINYNEQADGLATQGSSSIYRLRVMDKDGKVIREELL